ncbi:MAG: TolC family protein [Pedobacter sp.]|nr:TolC family protein [Chitinophagaceae bacterium]
MEKIFLEKNLQVLAQKYNVEVAKALIIQAKLWPNPNINISNGIYNTQNKRFFQIADRDSTFGEQGIQLSQLIVLAGKIKKQVKVAETSYHLAEYGLYDLLRTLKLALRSSFFNIYYLRQTATVYDKEIGALKVIVAAFEEQVGSGYITQTDLVRVQAQLYSLQNEYQLLLDNINDQQSQLRLLVKATPTTFIVPLVDTIAIQNTNPLAFTMASLLDSAFANRTDLMIANGNLLLSQQNYSLQKAMAVPDLSVGISYDKHGSYTPFFTSAGVGINIPIFNRNQGNIKSSRIVIDVNKVQLQFTKDIMLEQVSRGLQKAIDADKLYKQINPAFANHFDVLAESMMQSYKQRFVRLVDFLSFYDSYKQNIVQLNTILSNKINALENINFFTGSNLFN